MKRFVFGLAILLAALQLSIKASCAWDNINTHRSMTRLAVANKDVVDLDLFVTNKLGVIAGLGQSVGTSSLRESIINGSFYEDELFNRDDRARNHFHNPAKPAIDAGLVDLFGRFSGNSAQLWALNAMDNEWDYEDFKGAYLLAMTAPTQLERRLALQKSLRTAGHLMHLIQDMAVPAHTRNDLAPGHILRLFRKRKPFSNPLEYYLQQHPELIENVTIAEIPRFPRFQNYFDTGTYRNNGFQPVSGTSIGLAEYTSSTFFSEGAMYAENRDVTSRDWLPHPARMETQEWDEARDLALDYPHLENSLDEMSGTGVVLRYASLVSGDPERSIDHLAVVGFWADPMSYEVGSPDQSVFFDDFILDEACDRDYLEKLVPKSIAYSAGLLAHIFRGDIDFSYDSGAGQIKIMNLSREEIVGEFKLYYDKSDGTRAPVPGTMWNLLLLPSASVTVACPALPRDIGVDGNLTVVFKGSQGSETGHVTGKEARFPLYNFSYRTELERFYLTYPEERESWQGPTLDDDWWKRSYSISMKLENKIADILVSRQTSFYLHIQATPGMCKSLGLTCPGGSWLPLTTSMYYYPDIMEYFKVETEKDTWTWVYDRSNTHFTVGWPKVFYPPIYYEGLWTPFTGFPEKFHSLPTGNNNADECTLTINQASPAFGLGFTYPYNPTTKTYEPTCQNMDSLIAQARSYLQVYKDFFEETRARAAEHENLLLDDRWMQYGFEVRVNQLIYAYGPIGPRSVILDTPVTFYKPYGSDELRVY